MNEDKLIEAFVAVDEWADMVQKEFEITCKKGCSYCCYIPNIITLTEAEYLVDHEEVPDMSVIKKKIIPENALIMQRKQDVFCDIVSPERRKCMYLKNDECSVYDSRPLSCRGNLCISKAELCDTGWPYTPGVVLYVDSMGVTMLSLSLSMDFGTMAEQIYKVLKNRE